MVAPDRVDDASRHAKVGIVVPTLGNRPDFLLESLMSIRHAGDVCLAVVRPAQCDLSSEVRSLIDLEIDDPGTGLAAAINKGMESLPEDIPFVSWLGDDDRLTGIGFHELADLAEKSGAAGVFGRCRYIDSSGNELFVNRSGAWAVPLMLFGPQLIPQPGSLIRRSSLQSIGYLDESLKWAFDLEMFLKLRKQPGGLKFVPALVSEFRWHDDSLTVGSRRGSVEEASRVRRTNLPALLSRISILWEPLVRFLIGVAGQTVSKRVSNR